ncbi:MAG: alginate export family protein [Spirochaetes bacterium]|nr:alginate export family protein [Spirochaetota bacterium]
MKRITALITLFMIMAAFAGSGFAAKDDQYFPELQGDKDMWVIQSPKNMVGSGFQYGAWVTPAIIYQQNPGDTLVTSVNTFRAWFKTYLWDNSFLYVRAKDTYTAVIHHKGSTSVEDSNVLDLDLGHIAMATPRRNVDFTIGRKYFNLGSGLVFNGRGDGAEFNFYSKYLNIQAFSLYTGLLVKDDNPYGLSDRDLATGAKRIFAGGKLSTSWFNQTLYAFGLAQFDFGKEYYNRKRMITSAIAGDQDFFNYYTQRSRYESQYYGVGLDGVITSGLSYIGEFVMERGESYLSGETPGWYRPTKTKIDAYAVTASLSYFLDVMLKPVFQIEYAHGSGDNNRDNYKIQNGNSWGRDRGFLYFGTYIGGYALKPVLANMHVISGSVSFSPLSWSSFYALKNMTITLKYLYYLKHKSKAYINYGLDATRPERFIGQGVDLALRWRIFEDFAFFLNYGLFLPGDAFGYGINDAYSGYTYSSKSYRHFLMGGFNISF